MNNIRSRLQQFVEKQRTVFQEARADLFFKIMQPKRGDRVLDLGGNRGQFATLLKARGELAITVADVTDFSTECAAHKCDFVLLPESGTLAFNDESYDTVFSNSV